MKKECPEIALNYYQNIRQKGLPYASEQLHEYLEKTKTSVKPQTVTARLHSIGKELGKIIENEPGKFDLLKQMWHFETVQERLLAINALSYLLEKYPDEVKNFLLDLADDIQNWKISLQMAMRLIAQMVINNPDEFFLILNRWAESNDPIKRQMAMSCIPPYIRSDKGNIDLALQFVNKGMEEHDPKAGKAVSWALREISKKHPGKTAEFLKRWAQTDNSYTKKIIENALKFLPADEQNEIKKLLSA